MQFNGPLITSLTALAIGPVAYCAPLALNRSHLRMAPGGVLPPGTCTVRYQNSTRTPEL